MNNTAINDSSLLREVLKTVEHIGVDKTIEILREGCSVSLKIQDPRVDFVVNMTSKAFKLTPYDVIMTRNSTIPKKFAMQFSVFYLHDLEEGFALSHRTIAAVLQRDSSLMVNYYQEMKARRGESSGSMLSHFQAFGKEVGAYKKYLKSLTTNK